MADRFVDKANKKTDSAAVEAAAVQLSEAFGVSLDDARRAVEQCNGASRAQQSSAQCLLQAMWTVLRCCFWTPLQ